MLKLYNKELKMIKHKVFISYHHKNDWYYKEEFERIFNDIIISKAVSEGDIDPDNSDRYIKRLIQEDYITDSTVTIVLIGSETAKRKHIDWEISASLNKKVGGYSGLLGIVLPSHPDYNPRGTKTSNIPPRLNANIKSGYAGFINWTTDVNYMSLCIEKAFQNRKSQIGLIDNSMPQFVYNR